MTRYNIFMKEPRCIRYFSDFSKDEMACDLLLKEGFDVELQEKKVGSVTLDRNGLPLKYLLYVERADINRIAKYLAFKIKK